MAAVQAASACSAAVATPSKANVIIGGAAIMAAGPPRGYALDRRSRRLAPLYIKHSIVKPMGMIAPS